jgi:hypothetical protein
MTYLVFLVSFSLVAIRTSCKYLVRFQVLTAVSMKMAVFWGSNPDDSHFMQVLVLFFLFFLTFR